MNLSIVVKVGSGALKPVTAILHPNKRHITPLPPSHEEWDLHKCEDENTGVDTKKDCG